MWRTIQIRDRFPLTFFVFFCCFVSLVFLCACPTSSNSGDPAENHSKDPIAQNNYLKVISPNGGESFARGDTIHITYGYVLDSLEVLAFGSGVVLDLFQDDSTVFRNLQGNEELDITSELNVSWVIPMDIPTGKNFRILARNYNEDWTYDLSDGTFSIHE